MLFRSRRVPAAELERVFRQHTAGKVLRRDSLMEALRAAEEERGEDGDIYCLGSLYLAGMIKKMIGNNLDRSAMGRSGQHA